MPRLTVAGFEDRITGCAGRQRKQAVRFEAPRLLDGRCEFLSHSRVPRNGRRRETKPGRGRLNEQFRYFVPIEKDAERVVVALWGRTHRSSSSSCGMVLQLPPFEQVMPFKVREKCLQVRRDGLSIRAEFLAQFVG